MIPAAISLCNPCCSSLCLASEGCFNYTSAGVTSRDKVTWSVGGKKEAGYRVCIRAQLPGGSPGGGSGIWPAHWMMPNIPEGPGVCDPDEGEIDILEMVDGNAQVLLLKESLPLTR